MENKLPVTERQIVLPKLGIETRLLETGETNKPVLLLLHGNPDNADEWQSIMQIVGKTHHCFAPDIPGYGKSPEPPGSFDYSVNSQIKFVDELLSVLGITEKIYLMVHDIGGIMGIAWAGKNTNRLIGLVITNTVAFKGFQWFPNAITWGDTSFGGRLRAKFGMWVIGLSEGKLFKKIFGKQNPQLTQSEINRIADTFACNPNAKRSTLRQFSLMTSADYFNEYEIFLRNITASVPCAVVWGDEDPYVSVKWANSFGKAKVEILPTAGHWVPITATKELADLSYKYVLKK